jgi:predicted  nucleic acid-binding Zn-ribbon protein
VLQQLDSEIEAKQSALREAVSRAALAASEAVAAAAAATEHGISGRLAVARRDLRYQEQEVAAIRAEILAQERKLYGNAVRSPREAAQLEQHVVSLRRRLGDAEDKALSVMLEVESLEPQAAAAGAESRQASQELDRQASALAARQAELGSELPGLQARREAQASSMRPELLKQYETARARRGGTVVAAMVDGKCTGCRMAVPLLMVREIRAGSLRACESCRRILVEP